MRKSVSASIPWKANRVARLDSHGIDSFKNYRDDLHESGNGSESVNARDNREENYYWKEEYSDAYKGAF